MAANVGHIWIKLAFFASVLFNKSSIAQYSIPLQTVSDCATSTSDLTHEFFDISQQRCQSCSQNTNYQTVSEDGLKCICKPGNRLLRDFGGAAIECEACPSSWVTSDDGWECIPCGPNNPYNPATSQCQACPEDEISIERKLDGSWLYSDKRKTCAACETNTEADDEREQCLRCNQALTVNPDCNCPTERQASGLCFESAEDIAFSVTELYRVQFGNEVFDSAYFVENIVGAAGMCAVKYANLTSCQHLSNMCVVKLYEQSATDNACSLYMKYREENNFNQLNLLDWPPNMPWLYYFEEDADRILTDTTIPTQFTFPDMKIPFKAATFTLNGTFMGYQDVTNGLLQLCRDSENILDAAYTFGTTYSQECEISVSELFNRKEEDMRFYDIYLEYTENNQNQLYAVPLLITNYRDGSGSAVNQNEDRADWQLVRRLFMVDVVSGRQERTVTDVNGIVTSTSTLRAVRYAQKITIHFELQDGQSSGLVYPPYIEITYATANQENLDNDDKVKVTFEVTYKMDLAKYNNDLSIAVGVLSALAVLYSGAQTWAWSRRSGKMAIDFVSIIKFILFSCGNLANVFFIVAFGASLWWFIFYKRQSFVYLIVPDDADNMPFIAYLATAFALKTVQIIHMIICQVSVDIFFVDWERPHGTISSSDQQKNEEAPVSIWRTYFVANEWNEIQTTRKINPIFQIFMVVLFLNVIGFGNMATRDPQSRLNLNDSEYHSPFSDTFRFAIIALVYLIVALVQWIFYTFIYERFVEDKVRQYVDFCSMSNVSVFILENDQFGYYIHGRSVHGRADTGMRQMHENLKKEEEDLCGQRGLLPNTEQQTFQMAVPRKLRTQYDRVILPINTPGQGVGSAGRTQGVGGGGSHIDPQTQKCIQAYGILNRFLQAFVDHSLRDVDYSIKDKMLLENILDMEFQDPIDGGFFYNDSGHSFDAVLFFGNETTLTLFEVLFFGVIDILATNYILAAILTYIVMEILAMIRNSLGRSNLAKKTLVDKRFLI